LTPLFLGFGLNETGADADLVIYELFKRYSHDELLAEVSFSDDGLIAYRVLAEKHFEGFGDRIRSDLRDDFLSLKGELKPDEVAGSGMLPGSLVWALSGRKTPSTVNFAEAGLVGLARHGTGLDRELVLRFVEHKSDRVQIAAITGLRRVGAAQDTELAIQLAEDANGEVAVEAAKTALVLSPGEAGSASRLVKSRNPELVKLAILSLIGYDTRKVWAQIEDRLYDEDEEIRKLVCAYAVKEFTARRLAKLLDTYSATERYFYNVVYFLDRALYAKLPLRKLFIKEIEAVLE